MSGASEDLELEAGTSGMMESSMMESEEYYNPEGSEWSQKVDTGQLCRVCANPNEYLIPIFDGEGLEHELGMKIQKHLPIQVAETDSLPQQVCYQCASTLIAWHDLVISCVEADKKLRELQVEDDDDGDDDKGAEMFESPSLDSEMADDAVQPSKSETQTQVTKTPSPKKIAVIKEKKPKLKMVLVKGPPAGTSGQKTASKTQVAKALELAKSKDGASQDSTSERCEPQPSQISTIGNSTVPSASSETRIPTQSPDMTEMDIKVELVDWEISSNNTVSENFALYPSQEQIEFKAEEIIQTGLKEERGQALPYEQAYSRCNVALETNADLAEHALIQNGKPVFQCDVCNKLFYNSKAQFINHVATHSKSSAQGKLSPIYESEDTAAEWVNESVCFESVIDIKSTYAADPLEEFSTQMLNGSRENNEPTGKGDADVAEQLTEGRKYYYTCEFCNQKHGSKSSLESHMALHSNGSENKSCDICGAKLKSNVELMLHISSVHGKKNFVCLYCRKGFSDKVSKDEHERSCAGDSPFECNRCDKMFRTKSLFDDHKKIHDTSYDSFSYKCSRCPKKFRLQSLLDSHFTKHTGVQQYNCSICNKGYSRKFDLKRHKLRFHPESVPLSTNDKSEEPLRDEALKTSVSGKNCEVGVESSVATNDSTNLRAKVINDKDHKIHKRANIKLYDSFCYQCTHCPKKFSFYTVLAAHMLKHKKETFKCTSCEQDFQHKVELEEHVLENHPNVSPNTSIVDAGQLENENVVISLDNRDGELNQVSNPHVIDSVTTQNSNPFEESNPVTPVKVNLSDVSDNKNGDKSNVSQELNTEGNMANTSNCDNKFGTEKKLKIIYKKINGQKRVLICHVCGKDFQQKSVLVRHLRCVHEGIRDFVCAFCQKGFFEKVGRDDHERIHTGEKPYKCDLCDKSFRAKSMLYSHKKFHFKKFQTYRFQCAHCPKKFHFQSALATHMRKHTGERKYVCTQCDKGFYRRIDLARHVVRYHPDMKLDRKVDKTEPLQPENVSLDGIDTEQNPAPNTTALKVDYNCSTHLVQNQGTSTIVETFECDECGKVFYEKRFIEVHTRIHTGERPHTCQTCGMQFRQIGALHRHLRNVHEGRRDYACNFCGKNFGEKVARDDHIRIHTGERPYPCDECRKCFKSRTALSIHKKWHSDILPHECIICGKGFRFPGLLVGHMKTHTGEAREKPHKCKECEKCFPTKSELRSHERVHTKEMPFTCDQCGKQFRFSGALHRHVRTVHEGRKDYPCHLCGKKFAEKVARDNHVRIHSVERPFCCDICGKDFKTKSSLYIHKRFHSKAYSVSCPTCQKRFQTNSSMKVHLRSHTGERPHPCDICSKTFITNRDMLNHRVIHSDDKPFECDLCGMCFRLKRYLTKHMLKSHNIEVTK